MRTRRNFWGASRYEIRYYPYGKELRPDVSRRFSRDDKKSAKEFAVYWAGESDYGDTEIVDRTTGEVVWKKGGVRRYNPKKKGRIKRRSPVARSHAKRGGAGAGSHGGSRRSRTRALKRGSSRKQKHRLRRNPAEMPYDERDHSAFEAMRKKEYTASLRTLGGIVVALENDGMEGLPDRQGLRPLADKWSVTVASAAYPELSVPARASTDVEDLSETLMGLHDPKFFGLYRESHPKVFEGGLEDLEDKLKAARKSAASKKGAHTKRVRKGLDEAKEAQELAELKRLRAMADEDPDDFEEHDFSEEEAEMAAEMGEYAEEYDDSEREVESEALRASEPLPTSLEHRPRKHMGATAAQRLGEFAHYRTKTRRRDARPPTALLAEAREDILLYYLQDGTTQVWAKGSITETFLPHKRTPSYKIAARYADKWRGLDDRGKLQQGAKKSRMRSRVLISVEGSGDEFSVVSPAIAQMAAATAKMAKVKVAPQSMDDVKKAMKLKNPRRRRNRNRRNPSRVSRKFGIDPSQRYTVWLHSPHSNHYSIERSYPGSYVRDAMWDDIQRFNRGNKRKYIVFPYGVDPNAR